MSISSDIGYKITKKITIVIVSRLGFLHKWDT